MGSLGAKGFRRVSRVKGLGFTVWGLGEIVALG